MLHGAAACAPVGLNAAADATGKFHDALGGVIHCYIAQVARAVAPRWDQGLAMAKHRYNRAKQKLGRGQCMAANIRQRAAACRIMTKTIRGGGIGHVIFSVDTPIGIDFTKLTLGNHLPCQFQHRVHQVIETHLCFDPCGLGSFGHFQRILGQRRKRFFAIDMLSSSNRSKCHFFVQSIGCGDIHQADVRIIDQVAPVCCGAFKPKTLPRRLSQWQICIGNQIHFEPDGQIKYFFGGGKAIDMRLTHKPRSD